MKKIISTVLAGVCAFGTVLCLVSCQPKELQLDKEYVYTDISFKKAKDLTIEDVAAFAPLFSAAMVGIDPVDTVKEFEEYIRQNIDTYSIVRLTENGSERIYIKPSITSIRITEGYPYIAKAYSLWLKYEDKEEELRYGAEREGDVFTIPDSVATLDDFYFSSGALHYDLVFNEKFSVVYNYELK